MRINMENKMGEMKEFYVLMALFVRICKENGGFYRKVFAMSGESCNFARIFRSKVVK